MALIDDTLGEKPLPAYHEQLRAPVTTHVGLSPYAKVHRAEWRKVLAGDPVEINPSLGSGYKVMTVHEWTSRWKRNDDLPECLACGSKATKEHHFTQTWCRGKRLWESESICMDCQNWSFRAYKDPDFLFPEEFEKARWEAALTA